MTQTVDRSVESRERMVEEQIAARGVRDPRVLAALRAVPRELFLREGLAEFAYKDTPLPIESDQTISQPYIVAYRIECLRLAGSEKVLEIGTGSECAAAVLGEIASQVYTVERYANLAENATRRLARLGYENVHVPSVTAAAVGRTTRRTTRSSSPPAAPRCRNRCASS